MKSDMKRPIQPFVFLLLLGMACITGCRKEKDPAPAAGPAGPPTYVSNEGSFMNVNASLTYIDAEGQVYDDPFFEANGAPVGDVLQSLAFSGDRGYAVVNNSQKVVVFRTSDFSVAGEITGCDYPRHMVAYEGRGYLTNGALDGQVLVADLSTNTLVNGIAVGRGPERLLVHDEKLFVANSGGWDEDHTVSVIALPSETLVASITVGDRPVDLVADANGLVWVLSAGRVLYDASWNVTGHTPAMLHAIDPNDHSVVTSLQVGGLGDHPDDLAVSPDGYHIYVNLEGIRRLDVAAPEWPGTLVISGSFNSVDVHPESGEIWTTSVPDFVSPSEVYRYSAEGVLKGSYAAGIGSNGVYWR